MLRVVVACAILLSTVNAAKILGVFMTPSYSHQVVYQPIWRELSLRGHQVTVLTPNPLKDSTLTNLTEIDLSFSYATWEKNGVATLGTRRHSTTTEITKLAGVYKTVAEEQLQHPEVRALIKNRNETFDLLLVEYLYPVMYAFKDLYNCPMIGITSLGLTANAYETVGNPNNPAINPDMVLPFSADLSLKERLISSVFNFLYRAISKAVVLPRANAMASRLFDGRLQRGIDEIARDVSLVIVNSNLAIRNVKPLLPSLVEISGIHMKEPKPLPKSLKTFLDEAKEGVIYFSLGSNIKSKLLPKEQQDKILKAFAQLPYKVLWKFENEHLPNQPHNVEIRKWLPQQDVLAHPNVKLFITQGGLQSMDEAIFNKMPMLVIPFFGDQRYNAHHLRHNGAALTIDFHSFTTEELRDKIFELVQNPKYKQRLEKMAAIASDQIVPALDKAVWWIEYVLRHEGAPHLKYAGRDMPFYQYFLLDVIAIIIILLAATTYVLYKFFKLIPFMYGVVGNLTKEKSHKE